MNKTASEPLLYPPKHQFIPWIKNTATKYIQSQITKLKKPPSLIDDMCTLTVLLVFLSLSPRPPFSLSLFQWFCSSQEKAFFKVTYCIKNLFPIPNCMKCILYTIHNFSETASKSLLHLYHYREISYFSHFILTLISFHQRIHISREIVLVFLLK